MSCTVCNHPQRQAIDQALVAGSVTLAVLSQKYHLSTSALHRHKAHLQAKVSRTRDRLQDNLRQGGLFWLSQALETTRQTSKAALAENNGKLALQAVRQGTRLLNILLKHDFHLDDRLVYEIVASPQWTSQDCLLPDDPAILARSREYVAGPLFTPCPDTEAPPPSAFSPEDLDLLQQLLPGLTLPEPNGVGLSPGNSCPDLKPQNRKPFSKSGKLAGKIPLRKDNNEKNQDDKLYAKIAGIIGQTPLAPGFGDPKLAALFPADPGNIPATKPLSEYIYEQSLKDNRDQSTPAPALAAKPHRQSAGAGGSL